MGQRRSIKGSRILITGASQGIGRAMAVLAVKWGGQVLACSRSFELLQELANEVRAAGGSIEVLQADVTRPEDRQQLLATAQRCFGGLDVLINNAGIGATGQFTDASEERLRKIFEVNFFGVTELTRLFIPVLSQGVKPAIVNISSIAGKRGIPARSEYSASKFAIQGFSEALRAELSKDEIDVLVINPGLTQTNFSKNMLEQKARVQMDHLRGMTAEQAAEATLRAVEKGKNEVTLSFKGKLLVWFSRFFPRLTDFLIRRKVRKVWADEIAKREEQRHEKEAVSAS